MAAAQRVPLVDLRAQFRAVRDEVMQAVEEALESGQLFLGPRTRQFEAEFASYCGTRYAVALGNGTDALHLALRALGIGPGDEVITVAHTFIANVEAIVQVGATPVFVDVSPVTFNMDASQIGRRITPRTRAILPVHLYGRLCDIATFSFYYAKNLGAYGECGAVTTSDPTLDRQVRLLRSHGEETRYQHQTLGFNCRPDELQCAILLVKLRHLDAWNEARRARAAVYDRLLAPLPVQRPELIESGEDVAALRAALPTPIPV